MPDAVWFSDAPTAQPRLPHCLVCWAYGRVRINHKQDGAGQPWLEVADEGVAA